MQKKIMIIGSGPWQLRLIQRAKERGYFVVNTNLYEDSLGFKHADLGIAVDIFDKEGQLRVAREQGVAGVTSNQIDIAVPTVAYVAEKMGLPGIGVDQGELFTNKFLMREFCRKNGFKHPGYRLCESLEDAKKAAREFGYPVVIKPLNNRSSRGVHKVEDEASLPGFYEDTLANSRTASFLIEGYIGGVEHTVEGFKTRTKHTTLGISKKFYYDTNEVLSYRLFYSRNQEAPDLARLRAVNDSLMEATRLPFGVTHAEYKHYKGEFYLIEFAARGCGANVSSHIVPMISGVDVTDLLIRMAMGEDVPEVARPNHLCSAVLQFFVLPPGKVKSVRGLDEIRALKNVVESDIVFKPGDVLSNPSNGALRAGHFIAHGESDEALDALCEKIAGMLAVEYDQDE